MLFAGKNRREPERPQEEKSLYPVLHVADSLKEYQRELVKKEVASLSELSLVGSTFSGVLSEADHFQDKLQELGQSFANIDGVAGEFAHVRAEIGGTVLEAQGLMEELKNTSTKIQASYDEMADIFGNLQIGRAHV